MSHEDDFYPGPYDLPAIMTFPIRKAAAMQMLTAEAVTDTHRHGELWLLQQALGDLRLRLLSTCVGEGMRFLDRPQFDLTIRATVRAISDEVPADVKVSDDHYAIRYMSVETQSLHRR